MDKLKALVALVLALALVPACCLPAVADAPEAQGKALRILATSDLHGKFFPWDYALNAESVSGSVAQLATAIAQYRTDSTLLVDAGDTIQDNSADIFLGTGDVHPMVQALNALNYDVWVTGNHEYNYGMDVVKKTIADMKATVLTGNVYDEDGAPIADGYAIFDVDGVRVAVIGMVTPNITRWDAVNLAKCTVTDPLEETRGIIDAIQSQYDVLVGVFHMGIGNEYGVANSGVADILSACPEFDVMVSSHEHRLIPSEDINGALVVQNKNQAQTMAVIDLTLEKDGDGWRVADKAAESVTIADFEPDPAVVEMLHPYDAQARADAEQVIGRLVDGPLAPENEIAEIPTAQIRDTALIDLINNVQMYYTGAQVSAAALFVADANLLPGDIHKCDMAQVYKYTNTLYKLRMTGAQLKKYMEWSAEYYQTYAPGRRIENLTWPDGTPVQDDDDFDIAVNNYRTTSHLLAPGEIFGADDLPVPLETDVRGDIGGIRELIGDYIVNVKGGVLRPECNDNWRITGVDWDEALHRKAVEMLAAGTLTLPSSEDGRTPNVRAVTEADVE